MSMPMYCIVLLLLGYYNNSKATSETVDSDGWLHSGDIGYYDSNQFFYIVDRCKELIKYKGYQVCKTIRCTVQCCYHISYLM